MAFPNAWPPTPFVVVVTVEPPPSRAAATSRTTATSSTTRCSGRCGRNGRANSSTIPVVHEISIAATPRRTSIGVGNVAIERQSAQCQLRVGVDPFAVDWQIEEPTIFIGKVHRRCWHSAEHFAPPNKYNWETPEGQVPAVTVCLTKHPVVTDEVMCWNGDCRKSRSANYLIRPLWHRKTAGWSQPHRKRQGMARSTTTLIH